MIIGSAGSAIAELMDATRTTIKFSRGQETYPGTGERICCISGPIANICDAVREVFAKMNDPGHSRWTITLCTFHGIFAELPKAMKSYSGCNIHSYVLVEGNVLHCHV